MKPRGLTRIEFIAIVGLSMAFALGIVRLMNQVNNVLLVTLFAGIIAYGMARLARLLLQRQILK